MLLEMIEEVLEEQSRHPEADEIIAKIKANFPELEVIDRSNSKRVIIGNTGRNRSQIMKLLGATADPAKKRPDKFGILPSGTKIELSVGAGGGVSNPSEKFEGNLIIALNHGNKPSGFIPNKDYLEDPTEQSKAESVINSIGKDNIVGQNFYKVPNGKVTSLYKYFNPKARGTSKADIAAEDGGSPTRISVKKENASLLSSEVSETCAILAAISGFNPDGTPENSITQLISSLQESLSAENLEDKTSREKRQIFDNAIVQIYKHFYAESNDNKFKINFIIEAMTGMKRFVGDEQKAIQLLKWDDNGKGAYYPSIVKWSKNNANLVTFDVRWRGEKRSAGARLDPWVTSRLSRTNVFRRLYEDHVLSQTIHEFVEPEQYNYDIQTLIAPPQVPREPTTINTPIAEDLATSLLDFIKATVVEVLPTGEGIVVGIANLQSKEGT
jgi:hypothetical protein